ncbi:MAG: adenylate/guanylate cyclase domain-containing protein [Alphaproteobacteria bacterium]|nr:adenylate/guanylate cyclase domain-containing protein [Alphaproteobacteria bacterium]
MERRLAAILAADVVGYSRLMGEDEEETAERLNAYRKVIDKLIAGHDGRVFGSAGDSVIAEFASPVQAVRCAVEFQRSIEERNADLPEDRRMRFRIGVNLGDVMVEGDNLLGDGVNVAARLEGLAEPGGICVRRAVRNQVRDKLSVVFEDMGEVEVKNIARPIRVFRVLPEGTTPKPTRRWGAGRPARVQLITAAVIVLLIAAGGIGFWLKPWAPGLDVAFVEGMALTLPDKPSIAVLPFANMSGDPDQEYFADGMTDDLITDLSKVSGLFVIARNSVFTYKGRAVMIQEVGRDLGVRYVLEGSVRRAGNRVRINAQLIDATTGLHLWAERYDREYTDVFAVQDEVIGRIVSALKVKLTNAEQTQLTSLPTENLKAYDYYLRAEQHYYSGEASRLGKSLLTYEEAIALDPEFANAYAGYARAAVDVWRFNYLQIMPAALARKIAKRAVNKALALNADLPTAHSVLALLRMVEGEHDSAIEAARRAVYLDPNNSDAYVNLTVVLGYAGQHSESLEAIKTALRLNPKPPRYLRSYYGWSLFMNGQYERAVEVLEPLREEAGGIFGFGDSPGETLAMAYALLGREEEARAEVEGLLEQDPYSSLALYRVHYQHHKRPEDLENRLDALRRAGLPEWPFGYEGNPEYRLNAAALEAITTGHTWTGWDVARKHSFVQEFGAAGTIVYAGGITLMSGATHVQGDMLCMRFESIGMGRVRCGYVYRNPDGTSEEANELTFVDPGWILHFSIKDR